eukprot:TRINITY_DN74377_c0_g1_i1.p1 TRINITY_DN74377_c0_g1~~TRINITY_DN74377_c0_g1_i1.p1  ORF type:complete len:427 (-),score=52.46 TRINITY_DN74377_c0_g1_i1:71-1312(-)
MYVPETPRHWVEVQAAQPPASRGPGLTLNAPAWTRPKAPSTDATSLDGAAPAASCQRREGSRRPSKPENETSSAELMSTVLPCRLIKYTLGTRSAPLSEAIATTLLQGSTPFHYGLAIGKAEYMFGAELPDGQGGGIFSHGVRCNTQHSFAEEVLLGTCTLQAAIEALTRMRELPRWQGHQYCLVFNNCISFVLELAKQLNLHEKMPADVVSLEEHLHELGENLAWLGVVKKPRFERQNLGTLLLGKSEPQQFCGDATSSPDMQRLVAALELPPPPHFDFGAYSEDEDLEETDTEWNPNEAPTLTDLGKLRSPRSAGGTTTPRSCDSTQEPGSPHPRRHSSGFSEATMSRSQSLHEVHDLGVGRLESECTELATPRWHTSEQVAQLLGGKDGVAHGCAFQASCMSPMMATADR